MFTSVSTSFYYEKCLYTELVVFPAFSLTLQRLGPLSWRGWVLSPSPLPSLQGRGEGERVCDHGCPSWSPVCRLDRTGCPPSHTCGPAPCSVSESWRPWALQEGPGAKGST